MRYIVSATDPFDGPLACDKVEYDPENAIIAWCAMGEKYPTCASIQADTEEAAFKLLTWAKTNFERVEVYMTEHKCPYKTEWIKEMVEAQAENGKSSMQWKYDQVFPFCMG